MSEDSIQPANCCHVQIEIPIAATSARVWKAMFDEIERWWLPDFLMLGADSKISFDPRPSGSGLLEESPDGSGLQWYAVQMYLPKQFKVYLVGHIAADWGGPSTSSLMLALSDSTDGCVLTVADARHGKIDSKQIESLREGWRQLFSDGLKAYVETNGSNG